MSHSDHDRARPGEMDHLLDHEYDGIQEYDNPLPLWWLAIFWATIVFTPLYILFYHYRSRQPAGARQVRYQP
jgi:hypothetical protein